MSVIMLYSDLDLHCPYLACGSTTLELMKVFVKRVSGRQFGKRFNCMCDARWFPTLHLFSMRVGHRL